MAPTTNNTTWTTPRTWSTGELVTASMMNTHVRDNLNALHTPAGGYSRLDLGADITTTSSTFTNVDGTNLVLTFTTGGGDVVLFFSGNINHSSANARIYFDILESVSGVRYGLDDGLIMATNPGSTVSYPVSFAVRIPSLSAASHTFTLQWKTSASTATLYAGAGTSNFDLHPTFFGFEI